MNRLVEWLIANKDEAFSTHSGMMMVATDTPEKAEPLRHVPTADPSVGTFHLANNGYELAQNYSSRAWIKIPGLK